MALDFTFFQGIATSLIGSVFSGVTELITVRLPASGTYDENTNTYGGSVSNVVTNIKAIVDTARKRARDETPLKANEAWLMVAGTDLGGVFLEPQRHYVIRNSTEEWQLVDVDTDPARAVYNLHVRKP